MYPKSSKTSDNAKSQQIASKLVDNMNNVIQADTLLQSVCAPLTFDMNASILMEEFNADDEYTIYFVTCNVVPVNGSYRANAGRPRGGDVTVLSSEYTRLDIIRLGESETKNVYVRYLNRLPTSRRSFSFFDDDDSIILTEVMTLQSSKKRRDSLWHSVSQNFGS
uniref:PLAT domain-containing protein n=1 Tax=Panagrellus redivivus TaxID=6233 RepID=A0A7E4VWB6_PANRE